MSPLNEEQLDQIHMQRMNQIKGAALKVFARKGISGTKMSMIAEEAGISQGLPYRYFKSKEDLLIVLIQEALEEADAAMKQTAQLPGTPMEQIRTLTQIILDDTNKDAFLLIQQAKALDEVPEKVKQINDQYTGQDLIELLVPIFRKGQQLGEFCEGDPYKLLFCYFSVITGLMLQENQGNWTNEIDLLLKIIKK